MLDTKILFSEAENAIKWIEAYVRNAGAKGVVIGNSGGKDSATVIAMCAKALGKERVMTVAMPCNSKLEDLEDAKLVCKAYDVPLLQIDLTKTYNELENTIINSLNTSELSKEAKINTKPRMRMLTLYAIAQTLNYLVVGTGNLCEIMVGYTTKWGDNSSDLNPIGNFTVEEVLAIGEYLGVPNKIISKPPNDRTWRAN